MGSNYSTETRFSIDKDKRGYHYVAKFEEDRIAAGTFRVAYRGMIVSSSPPGGSEVGHQCVFKVFKEEHARNYDQWVPDLVAHKRAVKMAKIFNRLSISVTPRHAIKLLSPLIAKVDTLGGFYLFWLWNVSSVSNVHKNEYVSLEPYLDGRWNKFNSNAGWSDDDKLLYLLQTFSHWSACKSGYRYMICDLQGVKRDDAYMITDPGIQSLDQIHGPADLGLVGMEKIFQGHKCNFMCRELGLWKNLVPYSPSTKIGSTYCFQLTGKEQKVNREKKGRYLNPMECIPEIEF